MARYKVTLAYDGTGFRGSQRQEKIRTVQGELEGVLRRLGWTGTSVILAGRTDTGVHATGQVASFDFDWRHPGERLLKALNAELQPDLAVRSLFEAAADFHPRFDAESRRYRYRLFCDPIRHPVREKFAWRVWPEVNGRILKQVADLFLGTYDFSTFGSATSPKGTTVRTVSWAEWINLPREEWQFEIQADAFLYRMVRKLVYVQVSAAQGKCSIVEIQKALASAARLPAGLAPAHGLTLTEVSYGSI